MKEEEQLRGRLKDVVCSDWTTETKDDSSFSVIGSSLGEFIGKLSEDFWRHPCTIQSSIKVFLRNPVVGGTFHIQIISSCSFITYTAYTGSFHLGRVLAPTKEIQANKVAVTYAEARPRNRYNMSKRRHNIVMKCNVFKFDGPTANFDVRNCGTAKWEVNRVDIEREHKTLLKSIR